MAAFPSSRFQISILLLFVAVDVVVVGQCAGLPRGNSGSGGKGVSEFCMHGDLEVRYVCYG